MSLKSTTIRTGFICPPLLLKTDAEVGRGAAGNRIQVRHRAQLIREGILGQVRVKLDTS